MNLIFDLRATVRSLVRQPGIALLAIAALGLGIGLPTAMWHGREHYGDLCTDCIAARDRSDWWPWLLR